MTPSEKKIHEGYLKKTRERLGKLRSIRERSVSAGVPLSLVEKIDQNIAETEAKITAVLQDMGIN